MKTFTDRHGKTRHYYRRAGLPTVPLRGRPGTEEFRQSYKRAEAEAGAARLGHRPGFVYAIRVKGVDMVKIGFSASPVKRLRELEVGAQMPGGLELLAQVPATLPQEKSFHRRFRGSQLFGEWFRLSGPVEEWVATVAATRAEAA